MRRRHFSRESPHLVAQFPRTRLRARLAPARHAGARERQHFLTRFAFPLAPRFVAAQTMGRMHSKGKGIARSAKPYRRTPNSWVKTSATEVEEHVCKLAKKGLTPSQIGVILRDSSGIAQVKSITGSKILRLLKKNGLAPEIPEDLYMLIKKAVMIRKHLERNRQDKDGKFRLILVESRIHRLARYYRTSRKLPATFKYESATASTLVA